MEEPTQLSNFKLRARLDGTLLVSVRMIENGYLVQDARDRGHDHGPTFYADLEIALAAMGVALRTAFAELKEDRDDEDEDATYHRRRRHKRKKRPLEDEDDENEDDEDEDDLLEQL